MIPFSRFKSCPASLLLAALPLLLLLATEQSQSLELRDAPIHLSWTEKQDRFDFVFSLQTLIKNDVKLESVASNSSLSSQLSSCTGYQACLLNNGTFVQGFTIDSSNSTAQSTIYISLDEKKQIKPGTIVNSSNQSSCERSQFKVLHHCSTHWNPPAHFTRNGCSHLVEMHSPFSCNHSDPTTVNEEHPCYVYNDDGKLIDLTPWIQNNGSSYLVDTGAFNASIKQFNLNICNEAHDACGPKVSACYHDDQHSYESGYNNLTTIKFDTATKAVHLTSLGQFNSSCPNERLKTVVKFQCNDKSLSPGGPKLVKKSDCENLIEWQTIHACPVSNVRVEATKCSINYEPLNIHLDIKQLTKNATIVEVPNITINGKQKTMMFSLCRGFSRKILKCEGRSNSAATACLLDSPKFELIQDKTYANNSQVLGVINKSFLRLADNRLYLETRAADSPCKVAMGRNFNETRQLGTRIEFFCSLKDADKPTFLAFEECTYVFEWASQQVCIEASRQNITLYPATDQVHNNTHVPAPNSGSPPVQLSDKDLKIDLNQDAKSAHEMHKDTLDDSKKVIDKESSSESFKKDDEKENGPMSNDASHTAGSSVATKTPPLTTKAPIEKVPVNQPTIAEMGSGKMNRLSKFFMIGLILTSLVAFIVIIFVLDKKTRLKLPLNAIRRQARQAFQPAPVPYTRVDDFNDSLDL